MGATVPKRESGVRQFYSEIMGSSPILLTLVFLAGFSGAGEPRMLQQVDSDPHMSFQHSDWHGSPCHSAHSAGRTEATDATTGTRNCAYQSRSVATFTARARYASSCHPCSRTSPAPGSPSLQEGQPQRVATCRAGVARNAAAASDPN